MTEIEKRLFEKNGKQREGYEQLVERKLRRKYSPGQELSVLRKRDTDPEAFAEYYAYAEQCKADAKKEVYGEEEAE
ncbi:MAG: hypothetical protein E7609_05285 [Ruminococcaceae bacterium]|nr:hypothetical protein [Oscillospiraceae bacterium]